MIDKTNDISINELRLRFNLSTRSFNVCKDMNFETLADITKYLDDNKDFTKIRNCGRRSNEELLELTQKVEFNTFVLAIQSCVQKLSNRARKAVFKYLNAKVLSKKIIKEYFIDNDFKLNKIKSIGIRTQAEIEWFATDITKIFNNYHSNNLTQEEVAFQKLYQITGIKIDDPILIEKFILNKFPIITFAAKHLKELFNLDAIELCIFKSQFNLSENELSLKAIADKFSYSRERIRQKKEISLLKVIGTKFIAELIPYSEYSKVIEDGPLIIIVDNIKDPSILEEIQKTSVSFSGLILANVLAPQYYLLSSANKIKKPEKINFYENYNRFKRIKGTYIIKQEALPKEKILELYAKLLCDICSIRRIGLLLDLRLLLGNGVISESVNVATELIKNEFPFMINNFKLFIPKSSNKLVHEYAIEALEKLGKPSHIAEIMKIIKNINPNFNASETSLKATMGRHKNIFIFFGRSSIFGLKQWEKIYPNIKGGTIRDIVEFFLSENAVPCHITDITRYVKRFRKTNLKSVLTNLKVNPDRFKFYKNSHIGLALKNYSDKKARNISSQQEISIDELLDSIFNKKLSS